MTKRNLGGSAIAALMIALVIGVAAPASAQAPEAGVKMGYLNCQVSRGWGLVFGSTRTLKCVYSPRPGVQEKYNGKITRFGIDVGYFASGVMLWSVIAGTSNVDIGDLSGTYGGATAGGALGIGGTVNVLVGGFNESIALQPVSVEGNNGLNLAAGVASLTLQAAPQ